MIDEDIYIVSSKNTKKKHTGLKIFLIIFLILFFVAAAIAGLWINKNRYRVNGILLYNEKYYDRAIAAFDKGIDTFALFGEKIDDDIKLYKGAVYLEQGDYKKAAELYDELDFNGKLSSDPNLLTLKNIADGISSYNAGDYQKTVDALSTINDPAYNIIKIYLGSAYRHLGDVEHMKVYYDAYTASDTVNSFLCAEYAAYYLDTGNLEEAKYKIDSGLSIGGSYEKELRWAEIVYYEYSRDYNTAYEKLQNYMNDYGELSADEKKDETFLRTRMTE